MKKIALISVLALACGAAFADTDTYCTPQAGQAWLKPSAVMLQLESQGNQIREFDIDNQCYEVKVIDSKGQHVKMYLDPVSGATVRTKVKPY